MVTKKATPSPTKRNLKNFSRKRRKEKAKSLVVFFILLVWDVLVLVLSLITPLSSVNNALSGSIVYAIHPVKMVCVNSVM